MSIKCKVIWLAVAVVSMLSCSGRERGARNEEQEVEFEDSIPVDTLQAEEEELGLNDESAPALDGVFNDFLFAYLHSSTLRRERTAHPLRLEHTTRPTEMLEEFDPEFELGFLSGDYFTTLYGNSLQMQAEDDEEMEEDSIVNLQRINLNDGTIRNFQFLRVEGHWELTAIREATFEDDDLGDFQSFCPEVPSGIISNIRKGQAYGQNRIVMRKSGQSSGLQEIFTFTKERGNWRLTRYEN